MKVLIVDDLEENLYLMESLLKGKGYEVVSARNGLEALDKLRKDSFQLIISDILMPKMDGYGLCREIKKDEKLKDIPFIFYTATYTSKKDEKFALGLGADKFIIKPQEPEIFIKNIREVLLETEEKRLAGKKASEMNNMTFLTTHNERLINKLETRIQQLQETNRALENEIRERKKIESSLKEAEEQYRIVADFNYDWETWIDETGNNYYYVSPSCERITGYKAEEFLKDPQLLEKIIIPENQKKFKEHLDELSADNVVVEDIIFRITALDGEIRWIEHVCQPVFDENGNYRGRRGSNRDITEKKRAEDEIRQQYHFLQHLMDTIPYPLFYKDLNYTYIGCNQAFEEFLGLSKEKIIGKTVYDVLSKEQADKYHQKDKELFEGEDWQVYEAPVQYYDGSQHIVLFNKTTFDDQEGDVAGLIGVMVDITELKNAENEIKESLREKEILLQEIHHRVKNNMQVISSLLRLQSDFVDEDIRGVLESSQNRVKSMALVHEKLYRSQSLSRIDMADYIQSLVSNLFYSYVTKKDQIKLIFEIEDIEFNIETAIPCGLILNELISNSLKYAFPSGRTGEMYISLKLKEDNYELIVKDDGIGLPEDLDFENVDSLGLQLVNSLITQLEGEIEVDKSWGTEFKITFRELEYTRRI